MFSKLSDELTKRGVVGVDRTFITDYMPYAQGSYVKVYLYGLSLASLGPEEENDAEEIAKRLDMSFSLVLEAFSYWEEMGLVILRQTSPPSVEYLPVVPQFKRIKKFSKEKYKPFNDQLAAMLPGRNILPGEYNEYYTAMESLHMGVEAMLTVIAYCIRLKGEDVRYQYILTVARNLAADGVTSFERVSERLSDYEVFGGDILAIFKALGLTRKPDHSDVRLFLKWTKEMGFELSTVIGAAKKLKRGGVEKLDAQLTKYFDMRLMSKEEIESYENNRERLYELTKKINGIIGVYYYQLDYTIETYITKWQALGFSDETLVTVADYCYKHNIHSLDGMNETVEKFYRQGLVSAEAIDQFIREALKTDEAIKKILETAGLSRGVITRDRDCYRVWKNSWNLSDSLIAKAASLSCGAGNPVSYMNSVLAAWHEKGIKTEAQADSEALPSRESAATRDASSEVKQSYTAEELNAMFDALKAEDL